MNIVKRFLEWIKLKEKLHGGVHNPPLFRQGEVWWVSIGENIGTEINGKSKLFSRPVLVYKKLGTNSFLGIPMTSQIKEGSWYVQIKLFDKISIILLHQMKVFDYRRLSSKLGQIDDEDFRKVKAGFTYLYVTSLEKNFPPLQEAVGKSQK